MPINSANHVSAESEIETDLCIIGSGAAGITIARELDGSGLNVLLLEAGGSRRDLESERELFDVDELETPRLNPEASRVRCFGGSTELWFGRVATLDPIDFEDRHWVPNSGWPIAWSELTPWLERAADILAVPRFDAIDASTWSANPTAETFNSTPGLEIGVFLWSAEMRMGSHYRDQLERSSNVSVMVDATVVELLPDDSARRVDAVRVARGDGQHFLVRARSIVLAAGGLENPRLLLASNSRSPKGIGNDRDLVGRCLMDHVRGEALASADLSNATPRTIERISYLGERMSSEYGPAQLRVKFTRDEQRTCELVNSSIHAHLVSPEQSNPGFQSAKRLLQRARLAGSSESQPIAPDVWAVVRSAPVLAVLAAKKVTRRVRPTSIIFIDQMEQAPDLDSRVEVDWGCCDRFGLPRLQTRWRIGEPTYATLRHMHARMETTLVAIGIGGFRSQVLESDARPELWDMKHPSGTTRMSSSPERGVVDSNGRVHGMSNLYVAGSSVFPTVGHANPTLTIVALAARLAAVLKHKLTSE